MLQAGMIARLLAMKPDAMMEEEAEDVGKNVVA
jgi:hypothetical protein